jgi:hypothetical protein
MPRDLTPPPKRTAAELDALAAITPDDLVHAQTTANRRATSKLAQLLAATPEDDTQQPGNSPGGTP